MAEDGADIRVRRCRRPPGRQSQCLPIPPEMFPTPRDTAPGGPGNRQAEMPALRRSAQRFSLPACQISL